MEATGSEPRTGCGPSRLPLSLLLPRSLPPSQQISSCCWILGRLGKAGSLKEKARRPVFISPWAGHSRKDPMSSSSGDGAGLSGSDSDWLVSGSSSEDEQEEAGAAWSGGSEFSQGWLRPSSAVALFLRTQTQSGRR